MTIIRADLRPDWAAIVRRILADPPPPGPTVVGDEDETGRPDEYGDNGTTDETDTPPPEERPKP